MEISYIILICQSVIIQSVRAGLMTKPESVTIDMSIGQDKKVRTNLQLTQTFLANQNVPVWIVNPQSPKELQPVPEVMEELGPFDMYWDTSNCATAVYFRKRSEFDAIIGHHGMIRKLKYNSKTDEVVRTQNTITISPLKHHDENRFVSGNEDLVIPEDDEINVPKIRSRMEYPNEVYIETLVIVNYDIMEQLNSNYAEVVSYVLSTFNMVDMLYSKIQKPKIRINIAGIIIASLRESLPEFRYCYEKKNSYQQILLVDADCGIEAIDRTLEHYQNLPFQSYDVAVFITGMELFRWTTQTSRSGLSKKKQIWGISSFRSASGGYRLSSKDNGPAIVGNTDIYAIFPTAAHEMAHLFNVPHDGGLLWKKDGTCDAHLMKKDQTYCKRCLQFSGTTPERLTKFFGTHQACIFRDKPRSLNDVQGPRLFWTEEEQCMCYGHSETYTSMKCFPIRGVFPCAVNCQTRLMCLDRSNQRHRTGVHMDGTPCDRKKIGSKVCWNSKCLPALKDPE